MEQGDHVAALNGLKAWFKVRGNGPVCLFPTPGWGASSDIYFETLEPLERFFTVVYLDTRGCGRSQRLLSDEQLQLDHFLSDLDELRKLLGESSVWVMGHSLGGLLAQAFALRYPATCSGLILLSSSAAIDDNDLEDEAMRRQRRSGEPWFAAANAAANREDDIATDEEFGRYLATIMPFYFHDVSKLPASLFERGTYAIDAYRMMKINADELGHGILERLGEIIAPTVIVVGDDDFICSTVQAARIHMRIKGSKLVLIEQAGHFPWIEQPEAFYAGLQEALAAVGGTGFAPAAVGRLDSAFAQGV